MRRSDGLPKQRTKLYSGSCELCGTSIRATRADVNLTQCRQWQRDNRDLMRKNARNWVKRHREYCSAAWARYYAAKLQRMPAWADADEIAEVYRQCVGISRMTGVPHHVDHIIPLRGETVSGLHVTSNLRIVPAEENFRKNRRFDPYTAAV